MRFNRSNTVLVERGQQSGAPPRRQPRAAFARDESLGAGTSPGTPARIVIIEDDYLVAAQMETALLEAGFEIAGVAGSADDALALAATARPTLAVMDIRLSGRRDGIDVALDLFRRHGIRSVFATAHHTSEVRARAQPAYPIAWLPKPYTMKALVEAVRRAVREIRGDNQPR